MSSRIEHTEYGRKLLDNARKNYPVKCKYCPKVLNNSIEYSKHIKIHFKKNDNK